MIAMTTSAVPRSCPARTSPTTATATGTAGIRTWRHCPSIRCLRPRTTPSHSASASFATSAGWNVKSPRSIQPVLPLTFFASGVNTSICSPSATKSAGHASRLYHSTGTRVATSRTGRPMRANFACSKNAPNGDWPAAICVTAELENTMTRPMIASSAVAPTRR